MDDVRGGEIREPSNSDADGRDLCTDDERAVSASGARGAWYTDPYGKAGERWWDGTKWTRTIRGAPEAVSSETPRRHFASAQEEAPDETWTGPAGKKDRDFTVSVKELVGERVRVTPRSGRSYGCYDVVARADAIGELIVGGRYEVARMACADGAWRLTKRLALGWELLIEDSDGQHLGWYSGRRWRRGGTIALIDDTQVDLRGAMTGRWTLQTGDRGDRIAELRSSRALGLMSFTVHALAPAIPHVALVVFTACTVLMLLPGVPSIAPGS